MSEGSGIHTEVARTESAPIATATDRLFALVSENPPPLSSSLGEAIHNKLAMRRWRAQRKLAKRGTGPKDKNKLKDLDNIILRTDNRIKDRRRIDPVYNAQYEMMEGLIKGAYKEVDEKTAEQFGQWEGEWIETPRNRAIADQKYGARFALLDKALTIYMSKQTKEANKAARKQK